MPPPAVPEQVEESQQRRKRPPSRDAIRYVALPLDLHSFLEEFAKSKSTPYDEKSISWAARQAVYWFKQHIEGSLPEDDD